MALSARPDLCTWCQVPSISAETCGVRPGFVCVVTKCPAYPPKLWRASPLVHISRRMSPPVHISQGTSPWAHMSARDIPTGAYVRARHPRRCTRPPAGPPKTFRQAPSPRIGRGLLAFAVLCFGARAASGKTKNRTVCGSSLSYFRCIALN
jgi:hypothetical protein